MSALMLELSAIISAPLSFLRERNAPYTKRLTRVTDKTYHLVALPKFEAET